MSGPVLRSATAADADWLARGFVAGLETYSDFVPEGWEPPAAAAEAAHLRRLLCDRRVWCTLAEQDGRLVGQVTVLPAVIAAHAVRDPRLAHLRGLFVDPAYWGTGLAGQLHTAAVGAAVARGYGEMRLFTPAAHHRARRFYEREGWRPRGEDFYDPALRLVIIEYRLALP